MELVCLLETLLPSYQSTLCFILEDVNLHSYRPENLKFHYEYQFINSTNLSLTCTAVHKCKKYIEIC